MEFYLKARHTLPIQKSLPRTWKHKAPILPCSWHSLDKMTKDGIRQEDTIRKKLVHDGYDFLEIYAPRLSRDPPPKPKSQKPKIRKITVKSQVPTLAHHKHKKSLLTRSRKPTIATDVLLAPHATQDKPARHSLFTRNDDSSIKIGLRDRYRPQEDTPDISVTGMSSESPPGEQDRPSSVPLHMIKHKTPFRNDAEDIIHDYKVRNANVLLDVMDEERSRNSANDKFVTYHDPKVTMQRSATAISRYVEMQENSDFRKQLNFGKKIIKGQVTERHSSVGGEATSPQNPAEVLGEFQSGLRGHTMNMHEMVVSHLSPSVKLEKPPSQNRSKSPAERQVGVVGQGLSKRPPPSTHAHPRNHGPKKAHPDTRRPKYEKDQSRKSLDVKSFMSPMLRQETEAHEFVYYKFPTRTVRNNSKPPLHAGTGAPSVLSPRGPISALPLPKSHLPLPRIVPEPKLNKPKTSVAATVTDQNNNSAPDFQSGGKKNSAAVVTSGRGLTTQKPPPSLYASRDKPLSLSKPTHKWFGRAFQQREISYVRK